MEICIPLIPHGKVYSQFMENRFSTNCKHTFPHFHKQGVIHITTVSMTTNLLVSYFLPQYVFSVKILYLHDIPYLLYFFWWRAVASPPSLLNLLSPVEFLQAWYSVSSVFLFRLWLLSNLPNLF